MTPLQLSILIHYFGSSEDFRQGDFSPPAVRNAIDSFRASGMLENNTLTFADRKYQLTECGEAFVRHLTRIKPPVARYEVPAELEPEE